jgi:hypothetical protein
MKDLSADGAGAGSTEQQQQQQEKLIRFLYTNDDEDDPGRTPPRAEDGTPPLGTPAATGSGAGTPATPATAPQEGHNKTPNLKDKDNVNKDKEKTFSVSSMRKELEVVGIGKNNNVVDEVFIGSPPQAPDTSAVKHEFPIQY